MGTDWYRLRKTETEELEVLDMMLLKRILSVPNSTTTGNISIVTIIKARRVNYLQYQVKLPKEEMLSKFFHCQWLDNCQFDWTRQVRQDLQDFDLPVDIVSLEKKVRVQLENTGKEKGKRI